MILKRWKISSDEIYTIVGELGIREIDTEIINEFGKYLVDFGKDFMKHQITVDLVDPKTNQLTITKSRADILKSIWTNLTYHIRKDNVEILLNKKVLNNAALLKQVTNSEYGSSGVAPYPLYRKLTYFLENNKTLLVKQFILERGM